MDQNKMPLLPLRNLVIFPGLSLPLLVGRAKSVNAFKQAQANHGGKILATAQSNVSEGDPSIADLYRVGTLCKIENVTGNDSQGYQIVVTGLARFHIEQFDETDPNCLYGFGKTLPDGPDAEPEKLQSLFDSLKVAAREVLELIPGASENLGEIVKRAAEPNLLSNMIATHLEMPLLKKQEILETVSLARRMEILLGLTQKQKDSLSLQNEIRQKMRKRLGKMERDALLREQMKTIREELGDKEDAPNELRKKIDEAGMPEAVLKVANEELKRLQGMGAMMTPESNVIRNYLDWLVAMPWNKATTSEIDLDRARQILDQDHFGLEKVKKRIIQHLSVMKLRKDIPGPILCLVGPPGVGKTSLGQSIARALGREFVRASLGGVRDEAEIRGHRRTYIGAMPGRLIQSIKRAGVKNPVFILDEIDKLSMSYHGDPASALLEVLDPEQNKSFVDHYLDVPFDLSQVFFIATANTTDSIPAPLMDRMEVIDLSGYTSKEKRHIGEKYLLPKQVKEHGLVDEQISIPGEVLDEVISSYTREAGVRDLQRKIAALCRFAAEKVAKNEPLPITLKTADLDEALGPARFQQEDSSKTNRAGVVTGLAWTPMGGDILFIEATKMPGKGTLSLTGQLGDVMKESAQIAMSYVRSSVAVKSGEGDFDKQDFHIHVPSGAIPKDGPSAGVAILTALASLISGKEVSSKLAMTGEITLRGAVMPVGGIKEKVMAAHRAGIKEIILPKKNQRDLRDVPMEVSDQLTFHFVETCEELLQIALGLSLSPMILSGLLGNTGHSTGAGGTAGIT